MFIKFFKLKLIFISAVFLFLPIFTGAFSLGHEIDFNTDSYYDLYGRKNITAVLVKSTDQLYFYVDKEWWDKMDYAQKQGLDVVFYNLANEFEKNIYPKLTSVFGFDSEKGIDGDEKITLLIHPMNLEAGGYFNPGDAYEKLEYPRSNQRKILYLNSQHISKPDAKGFLAHEFVHLITVNQKNLLRKVNEEIWLNEARADFAPTLMGYDDIYKGSNLERRARDFSANPAVSLTEWLNKKEDYSAVNLFVQYLVGHYGIEILADSLQSDKIGIESINYALDKNGFEDDFNRVFSNWAITLLINDCEAGEKYCYLNEHLKGFKVLPIFYYLPKGESSLSANRNATYWSPSWYRFISISQNFYLEFDGADFIEFRVIYLLCGFDNDCSAEILILNEEQNGKISINNFNSQYGSLTLIPFIVDKTIGFNGAEKEFSYLFKVNTSDKPDEEKEAEIIRQRLAQIEELKRQIAEIQAKINAILASRGGQIVCSNFAINLYFGMKNNPQVACLQEFLKKQGPEIYPEGLVSGNFLSLTRQAVIRFQEKYKEEILMPLNLTSPTGYVGERTREKINQLIK